MKFRILYRGDDRAWHSLSQEKEENAAWYLFRESARVHPRGAMLEEYEGDRVVRVWKLTMKGRQF